MLVQLYNTVFYLLANIYEVSMLKSIKHFRIGPCSISRVAMLHFVDKDGTAAFYLNPVVHECVILALGIKSLLAVIMEKDLLF